MKLPIVIALPITAALLLAGRQPAAAAYPEKPIKVVINYGAGGNSDTSGRIFIEAMKKAMGAELFPVNITGAGGTVGTAQFASSKPDGYTILYTPIAPVTVQPHLRKLTYKKDDVVPICGLTQNQLAVMVAPDSPYNSLEDLMKAAKAGTTIVAVGPAPGSIPHIAQAALASKYGVRFKYVPVGNAAKQTKAILGGQATISTDMTSTATLFGLKPLAIIADDRIKGFKDVPATKELGIDLAVKIWFGAFAPKGTPAAIIEKLSQACAKAAADPGLRAKLSRLNFAIRYRDRAEFTKFYNEEYEGNKSLLKLIGIKLKK
jgi:tripartite-type tricarboxylate transporter receptor subunit TctC